MERAAQGDREAFDVIMSGVVDRLFAVARLILRDADREPIDIRPPVKPRCASLAAGALFDVPEPFGPCWRQ